MNLATSIFHRYIEVVFFSYVQQKEIIINSDKTRIDVSIKKYFAHLKDEAIITIYNLDEIAYQTLISNQNLYTQCKIYVGYGNEVIGINKILVSQNQILSIRIDKSTLETPKTIIVCSSKFSKKKETSLQFQSGTTIYAVLNILTRKMGIRALIDNKLKNKVLKTNLTVHYFNTALNQLLQDYDYLSVNNDLKSLSYDIEFKEVYNNTNTIIPLNPNNGTLIGGYIQIVDGRDISFTSLPIINYKIGTLVELDREYLNLFVKQTSDYLTIQKTENILNRNEQNLYVIHTLEYTLDITGSFNVKVIARPYLSYQRDIKRVI